MSYHTHKLSQFADNVIGDQRCAGNFDIRSDQDFINQSEVNKKKRKRKDVQPISANLQKLNSFRANNIPQYPQNEIPELNKKISPKIVSSKRVAKAVVAVPLIFHKPDLTPGYNKGNSQSKKLKQKEIIDKSCTEMHNKVSCSEKKPSQVQNCLKNIDFVWSRQDRSHVKASTNENVDGMAKITSEPSSYGKEGTVQSLNAKDVFVKNTTNISLCKGTIQTSDVEASGKFSSGTTLKEKEDLDVGCRQIKLHETPLHIIKECESQPSYFYVDTCNSKGKISLETPSIGKKCFNTYSKDTEESYHKKENTEHNLTTTPVENEDKTFPNTDTTQKIWQKVDSSFAKQPSSNQNDRDKKLKRTNANLSEFNDMDNIEIKIEFVDNEETNNSSEDNYFHVTNQIIALEFPFLNVNNVKNGDDCMMIIYPKEPIFFPDDFGGPYLDYVRLLVKSNERYYFQVLRKTIQTGLFDPEVVKKILQIMTSDHYRLCSGLPMLLKTKQALLDSESGNLRNWHEIDRIDSKHCFLWFSPDNTKTDGDEISICRKCKNLILKLRKKEAILDLKTKQ